MSVESVLEVGVAVKNVEEATRLFTSILGARHVETTEVAMYQMRFSYCQIGDVMFELMEPTSENGTIADFIKRRGEGLHHIALKVSDINETMDLMKKNNIRLIDQQPHFVELEKGTGMVAFVHPKAFNGVMFELIQLLKTKIE